jgi:hypothetical protein
VLVVGLGTLGQHVLVQAARRWRYARPDGAARCRITVVDADATARSAAARARYPGLEQACEVAPVELEPGSPEFERATFLAGVTPVTRAYVCLEDDPASLAAALALQRRLRASGAPVVACLSRQLGMAELLRATERGGGRPDTLVTFPLLEQTSRPEDLILQGAYEALARAIHAEYLRLAARQGHTPTTRPAMVPWEQLPEGMRESNRRQADHIGVKLRAIGCDVEPLDEWDADPFEFSPEEVERLAGMEHARWMDERLSQGWRLGARDDARRLHPDLVPWEQLSEPTRDYDRGAVLHIPELLAQVGLQVRRDPRAAPRADGA